MEKIIICLKLKHGQQWQETNPRKPTLQLRARRPVQFASEICMPTRLTRRPYTLNITSVSFCGLTGQSKVGHTGSKNRLGAGEEDQSNAIVKTEIGSERKITD